MRIGELCARTGLSKETVRYYERAGLLEKIPQPNGSNNYKVYSAVDLQRLKLIGHAKMLGFTLLKSPMFWRSGLMIALRGGKQAALRRKLAQLAEKEAALNELRTRLTDAFIKSVSRVLMYFKRPTRAVYATGGFTTSSAHRVQSF